MAPSNSYQPRVGASPQFIFPDDDVNSCPPLTSYLSIYENFDPFDIPGFFSFGPPVSLLQIAVSNETKLKFIVQTADEGIIPRPWQYDPWLSHENSSTQAPAELPVIPTADLCSPAAYQCQQLAPVSLRQPLPSTALGSVSNYAMQPIQSNEATPESHNPLQCLSHLQNDRREPRYGDKYNVNSPLASTIQSTPSIPTNPPSESRFQLEAVKAQTDGDNLAIPTTSARKRSRMRFTDKQKKDYREVRAKGSCLRCKVLREKVRTRSPLDV